MEFSPQSVSNKSFEIVKKGYEPLAVKKYLAELAAAIEASQNEAAAMEARARAAVARLQELSNQQAAAASSSSSVAPSAATIAAPAPAAVAPVAATVAESETISRTLLLAQRTADATRADAEAEARRVTESARTEAQKVIDAARHQAGRVLEESKAEARQAGEGERLKVEGEVQSLLARREFLVSDVEHLEQHTVTHRERLREVIASLQDIIGRAPGGLADLRRPLVSASGEDSGSDAVKAGGVSLDSRDAARSIEVAVAASDGTDEAGIAADSQDPTQRIEVVTEDADSEADSHAEFAVGGEAI